MVVGVTGIIGLVGYSGTGKSTIARRLVQQLGCPRVSIADAVKAEVARLYPETLKAIGAPDPFVKPTPPGLRALLQDHGMLRRHEDADYWLRRWVVRLEPGWVVVDDVRFPNEVEMIRSFDRSLLIRLERPGVTQRYDHPSENSVATLPVDLVIELGGAHDDEAASTLIRQHLGRVAGRSDSLAP